MQSKSLSKESVNQLISDSFSHRIYDDLCEDILKWLSIEEKIKLTAVSQQFCRCLHSLWLRQTVLKIDSELNSDRSDSKTLLMSNGWSSQESVQNVIERVLQMFPNIKEIHIERVARFQSFTNFMLGSIMRHCTRLQSFTFSSVNCCSQVIKEFGQTFGQNLRSIEVVDRTQTIKQLIGFSPNLSTINNIYFENLFENNEILIKNVKKLKVYGVSDKQLLDSFVDTNQGLTHLNISFSFETPFHRTDAIGKLSELKELKVLKISFIDCILYDQNIVKSIKLIANNCKNLKSFGFEVESRKSFDTKHCFESFKHFSTLKRFYLNSHDSSTPNPIPSQKLESYCLQNCKQLTHLELMSDQIDDLFFADIDSTFVELKQLVIGMIGKNITDITMEGMTRLKHLESLHIKRLDASVMNSKSITDSGLQKLFNRCNRLHTFGVFSKMRFTETTVQTLVNKGERNPLIYYKYYLRSIEDSVNVEEVLKTRDYPLNNIIIAGSKHMFDRVKHFN